MVTSCGPLANWRPLGILIMQAPVRGVRRRPARSAVIGCDKVAIGCLVQIPPPKPGFDRKKQFHAYRAEVDIIYK